MISSNIYQQQDFKRLAWKNGLGFTTELARHEIDGDEFLWRLSIAEVKTDGPFSNFSGYMRNLVLLEGKGITLNHDGVRSDVLAKQFEFACFDGKTETVASLHDGPITDFNIMTRHQYCQASVHTGLTNHDNRIGLNAELVFVYAPAADLMVSIEQHGDQLLAQGELLEIKGARQQRLTIDRAPFILVQLTLANQS
jgi:environmental stress-induced protein Ves